MAKYRLLLSIFIFSSFLYAQSCPLPEHPRPDFERESWVNLNGLWSFEFDAENSGIAERWYLGVKSFTRQINVPFPWGSPLSGIDDEADPGIGRAGKDLIPVSIEFPRREMRVGVNERHSAQAYFTIPPLAMSPDGVTNASLPLASDAARSMPCDS